MLSIVGIFGCDKVLVFFFFFFGGGGGMMKFAGICLGYAKFVGIVLGLKSGLRPSPVARIPTPEVCDL